MALEAVVFPQDPFGFPCKEMYGMGGGAWGYELGGVGEEERRGVALECGMGGGNWEAASSTLVQSFEEWEMNSSSPEAHGGATAATTVGGLAAEAAVSRRKRRRRAKSVKNKEEVENQRMTHIALERNRRKQMNEYLAVLRSLMPPSYVQRGDQASIVGGAINYVKELEQLLQALEVQKRRRHNSATNDLASPFADFFTFPQYSCYSGSNSSSSSSSTNNNSSSSSSNGTTYTNNLDNTKEMVPGTQHSGMANIEVTLVESHANLKVLSQRRPKLLLHLVASLQNLRFTPLHLNVTTVDQMVLCSFSLKVEDDCQFTSVDEIATAVHQILGRIQEYSDLIDSKVGIEFLSRVMCTRQGYHE